jgi:deoxyribodipyrimidine photo-lyase
MSKKSNKRIDEYFSSDKTKVNVNESKRKKIEDKVINESIDCNKQLYNKIKTERKSFCNSIEEFNYNKKRIRVLTKPNCEQIKDNCNGVMYWMSRDQRVEDNWALLYAQRVGLKYKCPVFVCFCLVPNFLNATIRHFMFMLKGLQEVEHECKALNISFHLLIGEAVQVLPQFVQKHKIGAVITDFSPLRISKQWSSKLSNELSSQQIPICQIDSHNIVPVWVTSNKCEYSARTIRSKIHNLLPEFLTQFPPVIKHPYSLTDDQMKHTNQIDWNSITNSLTVDRTVGEVDWIQSGTKAAFEMLEKFCSSKLKDFATERNNPNNDNLSNLSPYFHFGQLSAQRAILVVNQFKSKHKASVEAFVEEAVIRRELSDNFCFYNENYDKIEGTSDWAKKTLNDHKGDKREYLYSLEQFEKALTHDDLWNAAQRQMVRTGKMHGFLRMYWAKKILEWTKTPEEALNFAIYLNDRYELDGRDPSGYVGCMWSICGLHDQGWQERPVFGKIRFMNYNGCKRKFDVNAFVNKYRK